MNSHDDLRATNNAGSDPNGSPANESIDSEERPELELTEAELLQMSGHDFF